ncbi:hypothetical protein NQ318_017478 [Aromia moschata]|uniref:Uncharacterized protein n=1 Tax=Aromia moschata TaxID=1265417 RepID=A0AAV8Z3T7_9CUCU|nr:hypothetical protein NQ318_017478 [Aromia moschata]
MGLFGGFKAKFTRNSTSKTKPQEVVCLKYHVHSEFDGQDSSASIPFPIPNNIKKNEVIRKNSKSKVRKPLAKSAIFQDSDTSNTSLSSPRAPQKSQSLINLNGHSSTYNDQWSEPQELATAQTQGNSKTTLVKDTKFSKRTEQHNGVIGETVAVMTNNHLVSTRDKLQAEKRETTVLKTFSAHDEQKATNGYGNPDNDQSTLIFMTQHSSETIEKNAENGEDHFGVNFSTISNRAFKTNKIQETKRIDEDSGDGNFDISFVPNKATFDKYSDDDEEEEEEFKVNVVQHDYNRSYSHSEDERSYQDEDPMEFMKMGFSSQAASIFFGQDIEPIQPRPRKIMLKETDEDDRRSSGADC